MLLGKLEQTFVSKGHLVGVDAHNFVHIPQIIHLILQLLRLFDFLLIVDTGRIANHGGHFLKERLKDFADPLVNSLVHVSSRFNLQLVSVSYFVIFT